MYHHNTYVKAAYDNFDNKRRYDDDDDDDDDKRRLDNRRSSIGIRMHTLVKVRSKTDCAARA